jgi:hypothetical protein
MNGMKRKDAPSRNRRADATSDPLPVNAMMWTLDDPAIEEKTLRAHAFDDIRRAGFDGVVVSVRAGRYCWSDEEAIAALAHVTTLTAAAGLTFWLVADPRMISHRLVRHDGKRMIVSGGSTVPRRTPLAVAVRGGRFNARCRIRPRVTHTMNEVAMTFRPIGIAHAYLVDASSMASRDITGETRFFHNASGNYVEAYGRVDTRGGRARVTVSFLFETNHFDYDSAAQRAEYVRALAALHAGGARPSRIVWDEPGYPCVNGCFPVNEVIMDDAVSGVVSPPRVQRLLWERAPGDEAAFRGAYYKAIQDEIISARREINDALRAASIPFRVEGIHDTWRWESADSADRLHGSLDLWKSGRGGRAAFVDLGSIQLLRAPSNDFHSNLAGISAAALGLGRRSRAGVAFNNMWTTGEARWQRGVMSHAVDALALNGARWIAHIYGPAGVLGAHHSFLGLDVTPGYPHHSTWRMMPDWTARLRAHHERLAGALPVPDVTMVFPLGTLYALDKSAADAVFADLFRAILYLTDHHLTVELVSEADLRGVRGRAAARCVVHAYPSRTHAARALPLPDALHCVYAGPVPPTVVCDPAGAGVPGTSDPEALFALLGSMGPKRELTAPPRCWATRCAVPGGHVVTLIPARHGYRYRGLLVFRGTRVEIPSHDGLCRVLFDENNTVVGMEAV